MATKKGKESLRRSSSPPVSELSGLHIKPPAPPRPAARPRDEPEEEEEEEDDDDDDPFADRNVVETPAIERGEPRF